METEILDKMYLEWSQFTEARTKRELGYERAMKNALARLHFDQPQEARDILRQALEP